MVTLVNSCGQIRGEWAGFLTQPVWTATACTHKKYSIIPFHSLKVLLAMLPTRGLATYVSSVSFGHPEHCFLTVWTPKSLGQDLLMMTILEDSTCSVTPTIQTKQLLA